MKKNFTKPDCIDRIWIALQKYPTFMRVGDIHKELGFDQSRLNQLSHDRGFPHPVDHETGVKHWKTTDIQGWLLQLQHTWYKDVGGHITV